MPWFPEFLAQRLAKAERLLQEDEEWRRSADLQAFIDQAGALVAVHRTFFVAPGQRRTGLSVREELQGVVDFLRYNLVMLGHPAPFKHAEPGFIESVMFAEQRLARDLDEGRVAEEDAMAVRLLYRLSHAAVLLMSKVPGQSEPPSGLSHFRQHVLDRLGPDWEPWAAAAAQLERWQRRQGLARPLSATDLRLLFFLVRQMGCRRLGEQEMQPGGQLADLQGAEAASAALVAMQPGNAAFLLRHGKHVLMLRGVQEATAVYRRALQAAEDTKAHYCACKAAHILTSLLQGGGEGPTWSPSEVRALLARAERAVALCQPWMPDRASLLKEEVRHARSGLQFNERTLGPIGPITRAHGGGSGGAGRPGSSSRGGQQGGRGSDHYRQPSSGSGSTGAQAEARLPATPLCVRAQLSRQAEESRSVCAGCSKQVMPLRLCSACHAVGYCSRECQVAHWKHGGHKQACAQLAAARAATGGASRAGGGGGAAGGGGGSRSVWGPRSNVAIMV